MAKNSELIHRWFEEVWNQEREATIDELCAAEVVGHGQTLDGSDIVGREHFKQFWWSLRSAFTSFHIEIHQTIEEGDVVVAQWTATMQHTGPFLGIKATGKKISARGMSIQHVVGGKIVEGWDNWDQLAVMAQLGAISLEKIANAAQPAEARVA
jgi:steroid delta-isomerase-like uncharacterized protein